MLILFSLIVARMSGAVVINPIFGRSNVPARAKAAFVLVFSLMLYAGTDGTLDHEPAVMAEYVVMLLMELLFGFMVGMAMEIAFMVVRYASSIMDHTMGLSMAQVYDPQYSSQMTVTAGMYYAFIVLLFFSSNSHLRLIGLFFDSARVMPFGQVSLDRGLSLAMLTMFEDGILMGLQFAFPMIAMELVTEAAVGILMRMIPQINVFAVNFQIKIIVGMMMLLLLFAPMSEKLYEILDWMFDSIGSMMQYMA